MFRDSFVRKSGYGGWLTLAFLFVLLSVPTAYVYAGSDDPRAYFIVLGLMIAVMLVTLLLVRCPNCHAPFLWRAMRDQKAQSWLIWLATQSRCPYCEFDPGAPQEREE